MMPQGPLLDTYYNGDFMRNKMQIRYIAPYIVTYNEK